MLECVAVNYMYVVCSYVRSHLSSLCRSPLITVGERERTHVLHGEILYPTTPIAAPDASARAFVGAPQIAPKLVHL